MERHLDPDSREALPPCAVEYIGQVTRKMRWRRGARAEVGAELTAHFAEALSGCADANERDAKARELIEQFGDAKLLAVLCWRAKKRCRPLWRKVLVRSVQGFGVLLLYGLLCSAPLFLGKPTIRVNYAQWLSEHWRPADAAVPNAAIWYRQAMELYVVPPGELKGKVATKSPKLEDYNDVELGLLASWLDDNASAFAAFRQGARTPHFWPVYDMNIPDLRDPGFMGGAMKALTGYRRLVFALNHKIVHEVHKGNIQGGFNDCLVIRRVGRHLQGRGLLVEQLVGIALEHLAYTGLLRLLHEESGIRSDVLARIRAELLSLRDEHRCVIGLDGEKAFWYDAIQRTFTDDGQGGGRALRDGYPYAVGHWSDVLGVLAFDYPDRRETLATVEQFFDRTQRSLTTPPNQEGSALAANEQDGAALGILLLSLLPDAYGRLNRQAWALKTYETATLTVVAILSYGGERGRYPASLAELVETGYLSQLPQDPFGQGPLTYEVTGDSFLLYSWAENQTDEGGAPSVGKDGQPRLQANNGDWVFWPVEKRGD